MNAPQAIDLEPAALPFDPLLEESEYAALIRALDRIDGFGIFFVECSPIQAERLIERIRDDQPRKIAAHLLLPGPVDGLFDRVTAIAVSEHPDILFVEGLERSLVEYIKPGFGGRGDYYKEDSVPRVLGHLNLQRERFRDCFAGIRFVFLVPKFALRYFMLRAPDFFDWRSGTFAFSTETEALREGSQHLLAQYRGMDDLVESGRLDAVQRNEKLLQIQALIDEPQQSAVYKRKLFGRHGNLLMILGQFEEAIASFNRMCVLDSDHVVPWIFRACALLNLGRYEETLIDLDRAAALDPKQFPIWWLRSLALLATKRKEDALESIDKAIGLAPSIAILRFYRGEILMTLGHYDRAVTSLNKATKLEPTRPEIWGMRGDALLLCRRYEQAVRSYDKVIEIAPATPQAWFHRAGACFNLDRFVEAVTGFDEALRLGLSIGELWFYRGVALSRIELFEDAVASLDKAIQVEPSRIEAWRERSEALLALGRYDEASVGLGHGSGHLTS